ncbi:hypothetical protein [Geobacillus thermodenitrificans]|uniref:Transposase n=1 Tax=Geobacillus thermodenitrificans TaxID=33940 RepID=A0ABY9QBQ0_GEOTD|nr:hypothetical protein [Geobacillus thermodenitrificans]WMV75870.1 hypothetical protein HSX42_16855 [Geobacillus thermodenitrificans]
MGDDIICHFGDKRLRFHLWMQARHFLALPLKKRSSVNSEVVAAFLRIKWENGSGFRKKAVRFEQGHLQYGYG